MAFDSRRRFAEIKCPTLVVAASNDETVPLDHAKMPPATNRRNPATPSTVQLVRRSQAEAIHARIHLQRVCDGRDAMILVVNPAIHPTAQAQAKRSLGRQRCGQQFGSWRKGG